jgi:hypothetical protein
MQFSRLKLCFVQSTLCVLRCLKFRPPIIFCLYYECVALNVWSLCGLVKVLICVLLCVRV